MRVRFGMKAFVTVPALCLVGLATDAQQQGSSEEERGGRVAEGGRKARESKKDAPKPKKVYTDDDLKPAAPEPAPSSAAGGANGTQATGQGAGTGAKAGDKAKSEEAAEDPNSEKAWRKRFQAQHDKIAKAERELDVLTRELEKAQIEYYPDPQKAMTQQNTRGDINEKNAKIDAKKKELEQLRQGLEALEDQLRETGADTEQAPQ